jgi:hypothetical protein
MGMPAMSEEEHAIFRKHAAAIRRNRAAAVLDLRRKMWLSRVAPYRLGHDKRTFECPLCLHEETLIVKYK